MFQEVGVEAVERDRIERLDRYSSQMRVDVVSDLALVVLPCRAGQLSRDRR